MSDDDLRLLLRVGSLRCSVGLITVWLSLWVDWCRVLLCVYWLMCFAVFASLLGSSSTTDCRDDAAC